MNRALVALAICVMSLAGCTSSPPAEVVSASAPPKPTASVEPVQVLGLVDSGVLPRAGGTFRLEADGSGSYVVAEGDVPGAIATRFGLNSLGQLINEEGQHIGDNLPIYPDEVLTLRANE